MSKQYKEPAKALSKAKRLIQVTLKTREKISVERPMKLFYSYSHKDESLRNELETHLKLLQHTGIITEWHDRKVEAGDDWKTRIDENLERADIICCW